jgi:(3S)-linalool synthase
MKESDSRENSRLAFFLFQWATLFDGFMIEGKWLSGNQAPTPEDYLRNGVVTSGAPLVFLHLFFMLGHDLTEAGSDHIPPLISCPAKIMRLRDDMGSAKVGTQKISICLVV